MVSVAEKKSITGDEKGGPLVEESLLLGLAVVTVSIVIGVILQATGWAQGIVDALFRLLEDSWTSLTQLFTLP
jgi:ABC-type microcin C transport system permease subunit YejE